MSFRHCPSRSGALQAVRVPFALAATALLVMTAPLAVGAQDVTTRDENYFEMRLGGISQLGARNTLVLDQLSAATGTLMGFDFYLHFRGVGLRARLNGGDFSEESGSALGTVAQGEAMLRLGTPAFALEGGYARRGLTSVRRSAVTSMYRGGVSIELPLGTSGFSGRIVGGAYLPTGEVPESTGYDVESSLQWLSKRFPVFVMLGYRHEQFVVTESDVDRPQEMGAILLSAGLRFAR